MAELNAQRLVDETLQIIGGLEDARASVDRVMRVRVAYDGTTLTREEAIVELNDTMQLPAATLETDCKILKDAASGARVELAGMASEATGRQFEAKNVGQLRTVYDEEVAEQTQRETTVAAVLARVAKFCADTGTVNPDPGVLVEVTKPTKKQPAIFGLISGVTANVGSILKNNPFVSLEVARNTKAATAEKKPTWTAEPILKEDDPYLRAFTSFERRVASRKIEGRLAEQLEALQLGEARRTEILTALTKLARQQEADCKRIKSDILIDFQNFEAIQNMLDSVEVHVDSVTNFFFPKASRTTR